MRFRALTIFSVACLLWIFSFLNTPSAFALTPIKLFDLSYQECPAEYGEGYVASGSLQKANCFLVVGKAENKSGKTVVDADVFGRIYDANNNPIMQNRGRVGTITEVPSGISDFSIQISVPAIQKTPLRLEKFKASGFASRVRPFYYDDEF